MILPIHLGADSYDIVLERGSLGRAGTYLDLDRRVFIVTDDGVPAEYARALAAQCAEHTVVTIPQGEASKSFDQFRRLLSGMLAAGNCPMLGLGYYRTDRLPGDCTEH